MANLSIQNVQNAKANDISFQGKKNYEADNKVSNDKKMKTSTKLMLGATALAATVAAVILTKGKVKAPVKPEVNPENMSKLNIDEFKQLGKFQKGKATFNGKPYSGTISTKNATMTYENGYLQESVLKNGTRKRYNYKDGAIEKAVINAPNGNVTSIVHDNGNIIINKDLGYSGGQVFRNTKDRYVWQETIVSPKGEVSKKQIEQFNISNKNYKNGKEVALRREIDLITGKSKTSKRVKDTPIFWRDKTHTIIDGKKVTVHLKGNEVSGAYHSTYDPKTNLITKQYYKMENGKLVPDNMFEKIDKKTGNALKYTTDSEGKISMKCLDLNNTIAKKCRVIDCRQVLYNPSQIEKTIAEKGLNFNL